MAEDWEQYAVKKSSSDDWEQYAVKKEAPESIPQMLGRNLKSAYNESFGAGMSALNDLTANNIKPNVARFISPDIANNVFPEQTSLEGKTTRFATGFAVPAAKAIKAMGWLGAPVLGAAYGAGNDILDQNKTATDRAIAGATGAGIGLATAGIIKSAPTVIDKALDLTPQTTKDKVFSLYNHVVGGARPKNIKDINAYKDDRITAVKTISDNAANIKFTDPETGELVSRLPENRVELAQSVLQTKPQIWKQVTELSKNATGEGAKINFKDVVKQSMSDVKSLYGNVAEDLNPKLMDSLYEEANRLSKLGYISPTKAQDYLTFYNKQIKLMRNTGTTVDQSMNDLYSAIVNNLNKATDETITKTLEQSGYSQLRKQYGSLLSTEKELLKAANAQLRYEAGKGSTIAHPIGNLFALEHILEGGADVLTGNAGKAVSNVSRAALTKAAMKLNDHFRNPDRKIADMFKEVSKIKLPETKTYYRPVDSELMPKYPKLPKPPQITPRKEN